MKTPLEVLIQLNFITENFSHCTPVTGADCLAPCGRNMAFRRMLADGSS